MRAVFVGAGSLSVSTTRYLLKRGHEVVIIERDKEVIEALTPELDCGFLHGDGSRPAVLREADPEHTDFLFCLTDTDQANIIASLVGRSLGYKQVVTKIEDPELEHICVELGLEDIIIPARTIGRHLVEKLEGTDPLEISARIKGDARVYSFIVHADDEKAVRDLGLPEATRIVCVYRKGEFLLPDADTALRKDDEVILISHRKHLAELVERWGPHAADEAGKPTQ
jgi:trk system potassium uptake protein TrkA